MNWVTFNYVFMCVFVTPSILQPQFIEKGFKKTENTEQNVVLLLFLSMLVCYAILLFVCCFGGGSLLQFCGGAVILRLFVC